MTDTAARPRLSFLTRITCMTPVGLCAAILAHGRCFHHIRMREREGLK
jgi:hypothetical protein